MLNICNSIYYVTFEHKYEKYENSRRWFDTCLTYTS